MLSAEKVNMTEAAWLMMESKDRPVHVATLLIYSLPTDAEPDYLSKMVSELRESTEFVEPFNRRLAGGWFFQTPVRTWVRDYDLDLEYHVRHLALPAPGGEKELGMLIARLHSNPLDFKRPLWEYHVIEGLENNRFAVYFKMHHSIVDGIAGVHMLQRSMSTNPEDTDTPPLWSAPIPDAEKPKPKARGLNYFKQTKDDLLHKFNAVGPVVNRLGQVLKSATNDEDPYTLPFQTPVSILNHRITGQRRFATQIYEFERIRKLSKAADCSVNDIVLALCGGALRHFLRDLNALPGKPLTAGIPMSLRNSDADNVGPAVGFIMATLGTNIADPRRRLEAIKESTSRAKNMLQGMSKESIENFSNTILLPSLALTMLNLEGKVRPVFNVTISNVPGPREHLYFRGARLEAMYPVSVVTHGQALNITCYSYAGTFTFGFSSCRDTLPRVQRLAVYTGEELEALESVLLDKPSGASKRTKKTSG